MADLIFGVCAAVSLASALLVVTRRNPIYSALWLMVCFVAFAVVFLRLDASFLAAMHVLVYTGAILVLFLFVIMLLNLKPEELGEEHPLRHKLGAAVLCAGLFGVIALSLWADKPLRDPIQPLDPSVAETYGGVHAVGRVIFEKFVLQFELVSVLIIVAILGGVLLAKKKL